MAQSMTKKEQALRLQLQHAIGVEFNEPELLRTALTHPSYLAEHPEAKHHNQRLEFLGDAVLGLVVAEYYYNQCPLEPEGQLTKMRAAVVCEATLARVANRLQLGSYLRLGHGEELSGGRQRASVLADALEALAGAVFLDRGWEQARQFLLFMLSEEMQETSQGSTRDYKTALQELVQQRGGETLAYRILDEVGPDHDKYFSAGVFWSGRLLGRGSGKSKKEAEQQAARIALDSLRKEANSPPF
ncbi:MAG: ribonuclease III [Thermacetogeniaceae bacterium]